MDDLTAKIIKAKKKLKRLQKRQRKQDKQGVISVETYVPEHQALIKKLGEVMLDYVKDIYSTPCLIKPTTKINDHDGVKDFKHRTDKILNVDKDRQYRYGHNHLTKYPL